MYHSFLVPLVIFIFGACIGSFLNVCIYRLPLKKSIVFPGSACPKCGHKLSCFENIPIISYLFLKGRCSKCKTKISFIYPLVEILTALFALFLWIKFGLTISFFIYFIFVCALIVITFIDINYRIIPDVISLPGIVFGFISSFFLPNISWLDSLLGILLGGGILYIVTWGYYLATKKIGMGGGDIKLLAMIGSFLGWESIPFVIFISSLTGSLVGITYILIKKRGKNYKIPFGPFLAFGALVHLFFSDEILTIYYKLF